MGRGQGQSTIPIKTRKALATKTKPGKLHNARQFDAVFKNGKKQHDGRLGVWFVQGNDGYRFGFVVSTKVGNAVQRNRVKRVLREALRQAQEKMPEGDYVFVVTKRLREEVEADGLQAASRALQRLLKKL